MFQPTKLSNPSKEQRILHSQACYFLRAGHLIQPSAIFVEILPIPSLYFKAGGGVKWRFSDFVLVLTCESTPYCDSKKCSFAS